MNPEPTLALLTAVHDRHALARAWSRHYRALGERLAPIGRLVPVAVLSPEDEPILGHLRGAGVRCRIAPNRPLAAKWQIGALFARRVVPEADGLVICGSDDFLNAAWLERCFRHVRSPGAHPCGLGAGYYCLDWPGGSLGRYDAPRGVTIGSGRCFPRDWLDRYEWLLWCDRADRALDSRCRDLLVEWCETIETVSAPGAAMLGLKTRHNIHAFAEIPYRALWDAEPARRELARAGLAEALSLIAEEMRGP